jgi:ATP-dependent helicase Lhr and Lhr-like helicase
MVRRSTDVLDAFRPPVAEWFRASFDGPTRAQQLGWPVIARGESMLLLAPTGSGKTLTAFLSCIDRLMFSAVPDVRRRCRIVYVSPLKALAVDVERNLRAPLAGIANVAMRRGERLHAPEIAIRTGDTPPEARARFQRRPADILITTPESLYLILTSNAREALRSVETVIVDEIHSLVATKRGAHLALSLERLEALAAGPIQRIGLSATQRPLEEIARFLGGIALSGTSRARGETDGAGADTGHALARLETEAGAASWRPVTIVDTGEKKRLEIRVEVPVEDMAALAEIQPIPIGDASRDPTTPSIWPAIHPRLLELVRAHRTTLLFVNSRRLAERLAAALNELAGEQLVEAHHGSLAREQRTEVEDNLKLGRIRGLVATSSLELGIDMGAIDLVIQIEAPPSVASGMQRIGRAGHSVGEVSAGIVIPKYRGDLVSCAAATKAMHEGRVEETRFIRNPLDVLAQQVVAMVAMDEWGVDELYESVRRAAPYAELARATFEQLLDMLSGVYPSDEFAELRPRITWDRRTDRLSIRAGAKRIAILNGGTIPDRGLFGVFLAGAAKGQGRVGELDEEMVFEAAAGETFLLGASTWRIEEITRDRVLVTPAPGEPGKMPFWKGDAPGRPAEFGRRIGALVREIGAMSEAKARARLETGHGLDPLAATNLLRYLADQRDATGALPDDRTVVVERVRDELGDWLACVLSPLGGRVMAPWAMAVVARIRRERALEVEAMWGDDGFIIRFPETDEPPPVETLLPTPDEIESLLIGQLAGTSVFAAKFREAAGRALLLPKRFGQERRPLWQQRKRAWDLMQVASKFGSFPIFLETYRECLRDVFDMPELVATLKRIEGREIRVAVADTDRPSPFAGSLLFRYVANFLYDGDAPLAERRAHALAIDQSQLRELLGEAELRELLDADAIDEVERSLRRTTEGERAGSADGVHDLLLSLGDLGETELMERCESARVASSIRELVAARRALEIAIAGGRRFIAAEDAARYRDAIGIPLPAGIPDAFLRKVDDPMRDLTLRFARTRGPFTAEDLAGRFGIPRQYAEQSLHALVREGRLVEGEFRPDGTQREFCHADVLRRIRRLSLARLRKEIEPVEPRAFARFLAQWQGVSAPRRGLGALVDAIEQLQGAPLAASILESDILPSRVAGYLPSDLDHLVAAGEVVWTGIEPLGERDGRVALFLADAFRELRRDTVESPDEGIEARIVDILRDRGASFYPEIEDSVGGFPKDVLDAIWTLVWKGIVTNDSLHALRSYTGATRMAARGSRRPSFRARRVLPPGGEGRWSLVPALSGAVSPTRRAAALAEQMITRYGIVAREAAVAESIRGGFGAIYEILKRMEEGGKARRGYFVTGIAASQFAQPSAIDLLRSARVMPDTPEVVELSATDPANPWGAMLPWPQPPRGRAVSRSVGAKVILVDGDLVAYLYKGETSLLAFLPEGEPRRTVVARALADALGSRVDGVRRRAMLVAEIDGAPAREHELARFLTEAGFVATARGLQMRGSRDAARKGPG